jgi:hypothetical protein
VIFLKRHKAAKLFFFYVEKKQAQNASCFPGTQSKGVPFSWNFSTGF